jgi:hypothetical protein
MAGTSPAMTVFTSRPAPVLRGARAVVDYFRHVEFLREISGFYQQVLQSSELLNWHRHVGIKRRSIS